MTIAWMRTLGALTIAACLAAVSAAPAAVEDTGAFPYAAVVTGDDVLVRCGADFGFYAIGRLKTDDTVKLIGERNGFGRVTLVGPSFADYFGYVKYPKAQTARVRVEADGTTGVALGRVDVIGPNVQFNNDPAQSWKSLLRLPAEEHITVLETSETDREIVHKIALPPAAEAWISMNHLRRASAEEAAAFETILAGTVPAPAKTQPQPAPAVGENESAPVAAVLAREESTLQPVADPDRPAMSPASEPAATQTSPTANQPVAAAPAAEKPNATPKAQAAERVKLLTLADLEDAYKQLAKQPTETAEIQPLREQYLAFAERNTDKTSQARYAAARARQLETWHDAQQRMAGLSDLHARAKLADKVVQETVMANDARREYIAIGRLEASTIYDGQKLPKLLRLQDVSTGRTIAYLYPEHEDTSLLTMLGELVGIVGEKDYDGGLRLNVITPRRIDLLAAQVRN